MRRRSRDDVPSMPPLTPVADSEISVTPVSVGSIDEELQDDAVARGLEDA